MFFTKVHCIKYRIRWEIKNIDDMGALSESFKYGNLSTTYVTKHSEMGDSRKYPYYIPQVRQLFGVLRVRSILWGKIGPSDLFCKH